MGRPTAVFEPLDLVVRLTAVARSVRHVCQNSGESCNVPTRMLVPASRHAEAVEVAKAAAAKIEVGDPKADDTTIGPVASKVQFEKIQNLIQQGIDEGATLVFGGVGRPEGSKMKYRSIARRCSTKARTRRAVTAIAPYSRHPGKRRGYPAGQSGSLNATCRMVAQQSDVNECQFQELPVCKV